MLEKVVKQACGALVLIVIDLMKFQTGNCTTLTLIHKHEGMAKESRRITNNGSMYSTKLVGYPFHCRKVFAFTVRG